MIDREVVAHVAKLARIAVPPEELAALSTEMASIVRYVEQIQELDLADVAPLSHGGDATNVFRPDDTRPCLSRDQALGNAPATQDGCFQVPRVIAEP